MTLSAATVHSMVVGIQHGSVLFTYSKNKFVAFSQSPTIALMPLRGDVNTSQFFDSLDQKQRTRTLCILRDGLCMEFLERIGLILKFGYQNIVSFDSIEQMYNDPIRLVDFSEVKVSRKYRKYTPEGRVINFATDESTKTKKSGHINPITEKVRDLIGDYEQDRPSYLIAMEMAPDIPYEVPLHVIARVIRTLRKQESMENFPLLHEMAYYLAKEEELDLSNRRHREALFAKCAEYMPENGYLSRTNMDKVIAYINTRNGTVQ